MKPFRPGERFESSSTRNPTTPTVPSSGSVTSLQLCAQCNAVQSSDRRLRRCAGCFGVMYCSKECQKRAWPEHKAICRAHARGFNQRTTTEILACGFRSTTEFFEGLMEFVDAHRWAFKAVAKAQVLLDGGIEDGLHWVQNPPRVLRLGLVRREPRGLPEEKHFSCLFNVEGYTFITAEEQRGLYGAEGAAEWDRIAEANKPVERDFAADPDYVCCLPVYYTLDDILGMSYTSIFPLYRSRIAPVLDQHGPAGRAAWDRGKHTLVKDVLYFCLASIDTLFTLRRSEQATSNSRVPLPGQFVRSNGARVWRPFFDSWSDYRPGLHAGLDVAVRKIQTTGSIETLLDMFDLL